MFYLDYFISPFTQLILFILSFYSIIFGGLIYMIIKFKKSSPQEQQEARDLGIKIIIFLIVLRLLR